MLFVTAVGTDIDSWAVDKAAGVVGIGFVVLLSVAIALALDPGIQGVAAVVVVGYSVQQSVVKVLRSVVYELAVSQVE